jgi:hypothetical protein
MDCKSPGFVGFAGVVMVKQLLALVGVSFA